MWFGILTKLGHQESFSVFCLSTTTKGQMLQCKKVLVVNVNAYSEKSTAQQYILSLRNITMNLQH